MVVFPIMQNFKDLAQLASEKTPTLQFYWRQEKCQLVSLEFVFTVTFLMPICNSHTELETTDNHLSKQKQKNLLTYLMSPETHFLPYNKYMRVMAAVCAKSSPNICNNNAKFRSYRMRTRKKNIQTCSCTFLTPLSPWN